ncbi:putative ferritin and Dps [Blattamonas nauphoetae]|uniref:Ferritin n=1 Tax=Blattamonas nauphoetae TaxID=2049346 RepID=A0ABQ9XGI7_9EUKA|nr:putative ferritin and Dps [Blattamonas nauphoetae]
MIQLFVFVTIMACKWKKQATTTPMDVPEPVREAIEKQICAELHAQYLYNAMGACMQAQNLPGMAYWMYDQAKEEEEHAFRLLEFLTLKGVPVRFLTNEKPEAEWWNDPIDAFKAALQHEKKVTAMINELDAKIRQYDAADPHLGIDKLLKWFHEEQQEEEESVGKTIEMLEKCRADGNPLQSVDKAIAKLRS